MLEYRDQGGDLVLEKQVAGRIISNQDIQTGIAIALADNRMEELADVLLSDANHTLVENLANNTELTQSIAEELRKNPGEVQGPKGEKGDIGPKGIKGEPGINGTKGDIGPKGLDGAMGIKGDMGEKGEIGSKGEKGEPGANGLPGSKGEDGIGATLADQFLREIRKAKNETLDAKKAAEAAKNASEGFAKQAKDTEDKVKILHNQTVNLTGEAEDSADQALQSAENAEALHSSVRDMFCTTNPADQVCSAHRRRRETKKSSVTSGASRPTSFISQVINFFYPAVGQDEYKVVRPEGHKCRDG
ncbi:collagen-like protein [Wolbachia endosymbiont of Ostrinia scapulalis]|uniref:collagen-like protein n=1 Tax=Wolbachia endosymbiont of Ostrinia scapulalis TaxID=183754 RepID=UPI00202231C4|nr:collagen-like protein [Wolbachia endosymbiont of Ostrinia scapulalis]